jgi:N-acetylmuramoyl-L-alanine amidase/putative methionine-R-sulfoxide reductase with GAF domain
MATSLSKPDFDVATTSEAGSHPSSTAPAPPVAGQDALQALLAFSSLHEQIRQRRAREAFGGKNGPSWTDGPDQFVLYEVLQLVAERALALTGADGVAIALVQEGEIVCRAATGPIAPDIGARLDPKSGISGACFRQAEIVRCDDAENDPRVDAQASRNLNARSMVAVPLCGRRSVIGLIEAFSTEAYGFNESDIKSLGLLAELILGAIKPEEEELLESLSPVPLHGIGIHGDLSREKRVAPATKPAENVPTTLVQARPEVKTPEPAPAPIRKSVTVEHPDLGTLELQDVKISELFGQPIPEPEPESITVADQESSDDESAEPVTEIFSEYQEPKKSRSGLIAGLLAAAALAAIAAGLGWWRLHDRARSDASVSTPASPVAAAPQPKLEPATSQVQEPAPTQDSSELAPQVPVSPEDASRNTLPMVTDVRHWESDGSTTVAIDLQDQVQYEVHRLTSPERIYFDLHDTVLAGDLARGKTIEVGNSQLVRIRIAQPVPGVSRIVLETKDVSNFSVSLESNPSRLVAEIRTTPSPSTKAPTDSKDVVKPQAQPEHKLTSSAPPGASSTRTKIVVDAGHGGWDLGTIGRKGLVEKDLVLDIAQRLGKLLESKLGAEVVYTRSDDNYVSLEKRAELANDAQADLFVSVHANYSDLPTARGVETYYTNFSSSSETLDVEKRENATAKSAPGAPMLTGVALKERTAESRRLAASVERSLYSTLSSATPGIRDRGVKEAGFVVLTGTSMPAILAEVSFVSSPMDEKNLESSEYRQHIAEALYKGIAKYEASSSRVKLASAGKMGSGR